ncbi:MAG: hypothetical protein ACREP9_20980 [Candidatus Dormibacteraceae bacterium]
MAGLVIVYALLSEHRLRLTAVTGFELRLGADFLSRSNDIIRLRPFRLAGSPPT